MNVFCQNNHNYLQFSPYVNFFLTSGYIQAFCKGTKIKTICLVHCIYTSFSPYHCFPFSKQFIFLWAIKRFTLSECMKATNTTHLTKHTIDTNTQKNDGCYSYQDQTTISVRCFVFGGYHREVCLILFDFLVHQIYKSCLSTKSNNVITYIQIIPRMHVHVHEQNHTIQF